jgi:NADH-quinone oxidoreductase subunit L
VLSVGIAWETFTNPGPMEPFERAFEWSPLGGGMVFELGMLVDGLTAMMFLLVTLVSLMVHVYSREYMQGEPRFTFFFAMLSLFTFSMLLLVIANNTLQAIIGWELVGLCSFLLIGFYWEKKPNQDAANKAFLVTKFGDVGLIVGVIVLSAGCSAPARDTPFNIGETIDAAVAGELSTTTIVLGMLMIFLACVSKSGQMPLHVWLPDAMAGPTPVSALIHAATMVTAGVFLIARLFPVVAQSLTVMTVIAVVGVITLFFAGFVALVQDDLKKVLAYSTVSQLGYMMAALGVGGLHRRHLPPLHPRLLQGAAVPRRRVADPRGALEQHVRHGRHGEEDAAHVLDVHRRVDRPGRLPDDRRLLLEGRDPRRGPVLAVRDRQRWSSGSASPAPS